MARADAGEDALVAALARSLGAPVLLVAPGPREAERLARGAQAWLGEDGAALLPSWEALPYEGISPSPEVAARRAEAVRAAPGGQGRVRPGRSRARRDAGARPHARRDPAGRARQGDRARAGRPRRAAGRARVRARGRGRAPRRVRGPRRRRSTCSRGPRGAPCGSSTGATRSSRSASSCRPRSCRPGRSPASRSRRCASWSPTTRWPNAPGRAPPATSTGSATGSSGSPEGLHAEGFESLAPLLFDRMPVPAELLPEGSWVVVSEARRTFDRARRTFDDAEALAEASDWPGPRAVHDLDEALEGRVQLRLSGFTEGIDTGSGGMGVGAGQPRRARPPGLGARRARVPRAADGAGPRVARTRPRVRRRCPRPSRSRRSSRPASSSPRASSPSRPRRTCSVRAGIRASAPRFTSRRSDAIAEELEPGDFAVHRVHGVGRYVGVQRREIAGSERDYLVLEYA